MRGCLTRDIQSLKLSVVLVGKGVWPEASKVWNLSAVIPWEIICWGRWTMYKMPGVRWCPFSITIAILTSLTHLPFTFVVLPTYFPQLCFVFIRFSWLDTIYFPLSSYMPCYIGVALPLGRGSGHTKGTTNNNNDWFRRSGIKYSSDISEYNTRKTNWAHSRLDLMGRHIFSGDLISLCSISSLCELIDRVLTRYINTYSFPVTVKQSLCWHFLFFCGVVSWRFAHSFCDSLYAEDRILNNGGRFCVLLIIFRADPHGSILWQWMNNPLFSFISCGSIW